MMYYTRKSGYLKNGPEGVSLPAMLEFIQLTLIIEQASLSSKTCWFKVHLHLSVVEF